MSISSFLALMSSFLIENHKVDLGVVKKFICRHCYPGQITDLSPAVDRIIPRGSSFKQFSRLDNVGFDPVWLTHNEFRAIFCSYCGTGIGLDFGIMSGDTRLMRVKVECLLLWFEYKVYYPDGFPYRPYDAPAALEPPVDDLVAEFNQLLHRLPQILALDDARAAARNLARMAALPAQMTWRHDILSIIDRENIYICQACYPSRTIELATNVISSGADNIRVGTEYVTFGYLYNIKVGEWNPPVEGDEFYVPTRQVYCLNCSTVLGFEFSTVHPQPSGLYVSGARQREIRILVESLLFVGEFGLVYLPYHNSKRPYNPGNDLDVQLFAGEPDPELAAIVAFQLGARAQEHTRAMSALDEPGFADKVSLAAAAFWAAFDSENELRLAASRKHDDAFRAWADAENERMCSELGASSSRGAAFPPDEEDEEDAPPAA